MASRLRSGENYPLVVTNIAIENGQLFLVTFPISNGDVLSYSYVSLLLDGINLCDVGRYPLTLEEPGA